MSTEVKLANYQPWERELQRVYLAFELYEDHTLVRSCLHINAGDANEVVLHGADLQTLEFAVDGVQAIQDRDYVLEPDQELMRLKLPTSACEVSALVRIDPLANTRLEGLYQSQGLFCTQCEAEGFRRITWFPDRPDVMACYRVKIEAPKSLPVLLSNGHPLEQGESGERHWVIWDDPHPKPSYLFALVAGDLDYLQDSFTTVSGRQVQLRIYAGSQHLKRLDYAMEALKQAMRWDEEHYGREYDLDVFNIVAVDDFNMGAMENKGLNIFNTACLVAHPQIQTDAAYQNVATTVAHEYFHNWSGNRVTCRDWFQLSLKEGFTVFRDSQFTADITSPEVERINRVRFLRSVQFPEDSSPMAHPVRPESYQEISNFYTATIYDKGAEVIGMLPQLLGEETYHRACERYFADNDGRAATVEDFLLAMQTESGQDLEHFKLWYSQAGTPEVKVLEQYDADTQRYHLTLSQSCPATPGQPDKQPLLIPIRMALIDTKGSVMPLWGAGSQGETEVVLRLEKTEQCWTFEQVPEDSMLSLLRGFSAPVKLDYPRSLALLARQVREDNDAVNRWDTLQEMAGQIIHALSRNEDNQLECLADSLKHLLQDTDADPGLVAMFLHLPDTITLMDQLEQSNPAHLDATREQALQQLSERLLQPLQKVWQLNQPSGRYRPEKTQMGIRSLRNITLEYLCRSQDETWLECAAQQVARYDNMTDVMAGIRALLGSDLNRAKDLVSPLLQEVRERYADEALVLDNWFRLQASSRVWGTLERIRLLQQDNHFQATNPNSVRALIGAFCSNARRFHATDGYGYQYLAEMVLELDQLNPQIAARLILPLIGFRGLLPRLQKPMRDAIAGIALQRGLSPDLREIVDKALDGG